MAQRKRKKKSVFKKAPKKGPMLKTRKRITLASNGSTVFNFVKKTIVPISLVVFAAAAYWLYDVPIPESKKKKVSKEVRKAMKDPESQKVYL
ncbi:MAG: hypothetical protein IKI54_03300 [Lachnospiraceae bacterium]|nr:hypothetical protein [Lachnospiraceae bacterium]